MIDYSCSNNNKNNNIKNGELVVCIFIFKKLFKMTSDHWGFILQYNSNVLGFGLLTIFTNSLKKIFSRKIVSHRYNHVYKGKDFLNLFFDSLR